MGVCGVFWWCWLAPKKGKELFLHAHIQLLLVFIHRECLNMPEGVKKKMKLKQKVLQLYCCICISSCWSDSGGLEKSMEKLQAAHVGVLLLLPCQHCLLPAIPTFLSEGTHWLQRAVKKLGGKQMFASCFLLFYKPFLQTECKWLSAQAPLCAADCELEPGLPAGNGVGCVWVHQPCWIMFSDPLDPVFGFGKELSWPSHVAAVAESGPSY